MEEGELLVEEATVHLSEMIWILETSFMPRWEAMGEMLVWDEIEMFASALRDVAREYDIRSLNVYGDNLYEQARNCNIDGTEKAVAEFPELLSRFKEMSSTPGEGLSPEIVAQFPELIRELENEFLPKWEEFRETLIFEEVEDIANRVIVKSEAYGCASLKDWSEKVMTEVRNIDMNRLAEIFGKFPDIIEEPRELQKLNDLTN